MNKGLEALNELKGVLAYFGAHTEKAIESCNIIEKELKRVEEIDNAPIVPIHINRYNELCDKEQAFEIIKEKPQATLWLIQHCDKEMEYEDMISIFKEDITKEQFDLLKEVLL